MKRIAFVALISLTLVAGAFAHHNGNGFSFRIGGLAAAEFVQNPNFSELRTRFADPATLMPGLWTEFVFGNIGVGMTALTSFTRTDTGIADPSQAWMLDFIGTVDLRYHIFGARGFLDPFAEVGVGAAGRLNFYDGAPTVWTQNEDGSYNYDWGNTGTVDDSVLKNLGIFAQAGLGLNVRLSGIVLGGKLDYRFQMGAVPMTSFEVFPLDRFEFSLMAGLAF